MTFNALFVAACMFLVTRSQPLDTLSAERPNASVLTPYTLLSILGQCAVHATALAHVTGLCRDENPEQGARDPRLSPPTGRPVPCSR